MNVRPVRLIVDDDRRRSRLTVFFRFFLAIPAFVVASALGGVVFVIAFLGWWYALAKARMPEGMRNLGVTCLRYSAQTYAYALFVTGRYPYAAPVLREKQPVPEPEPFVDPHAPVPGDTF